MKSASELARRPKASDATNLRNSILCRGVSLFTILAIPLAEWPFLYKPTPFSSSRRASSPVETHGDEGSASMRARSHGLQRTDAPFEFRWIV